MVRKLYSSDVYQLVFFSISLLVYSNVASAQTNVLMNHNDLRRTGWNSNETILATDNVSSGNFGKIFARDVDDQIYAQPLVVSNVSIGGGTHNIVLVATVNNSLYAFDADDPAVSNPYWKDNLTYDSTNYRPVRNTDMTGACTVFPEGYQDYTGNIGIVGTPAIDTATSTLYVVSRSVSKTGSNFVQYLHAIDIRTGQETISPVLITATYPGTGDGSVGGVITFDAQKENQRPALLLTNGTVYICWSSHCDWGPYHGWVIAYDAATLQQKYVYNDTPGGGQAGIWMSGQGPSIDDDGNLILTTGNGTVGQNSNPNDTLNRGNSLIKLSPSLKVLDFFTPMNYQYLNEQDEDYGSDGALLIPGTNLSVSGSKEGKLYVIADDHMGGMTSDNSNVVETMELASSSGTEVKNVHGTPVYYKDAYGNEYIYGWAEEALLHQIPFDRSTQLFDTVNQKLGYTRLPSGMPGGMLSISSNGSQSGTGILWASHPINGDAEHATVPGVLQAFDATDITHELWSSNWNSKRDSVGMFAKFVPPTIANGKVYLASFSNKLMVYGLNPPAASACASTLPPTWQNADIGYVAYPGDVCVSNGTYSIAASGGDIWGTMDAFHYLFQQVITNETELTIRIDTLKDSTYDAKCGIMFRENLYPGSPHVFLALTPQGVLYSYERCSQNDTSRFIGPSVQPSKPYWLRIYNKGNKYISSYSSNGTDWTIMDSVVLSLGTNPYVGIAFARNKNSGIDTAVVDNVALRISGALSVDLVNFTAKNVKDKRALLNWTTTSEINSDHFDIERSGASTDFRTIGSVKADGNSKVNRQYSFTDESPAEGTDYYRLKEVDRFGHVSYSPVAPVRFNFNKITIYPNPTSGKVYITNNFNFTNGKKLDVQLLDYSGKVLTRQEYTSNGTDVFTFEIPRRVTNGMYIVLVTNSDGEKQSERIFVNR